MCSKVRKEREDRGWRIEDRDEEEKRGGEV